MPITYLIGGEPVDFETYVQEFIARGKPADVARALAAMTPPVEVHHARTTANGPHPAPLGQWVGKARLEP